MRDEEVVSLAFDILEDAEVMQEFDDTVWISVNKELWEQFVSGEPNNVTP